MNLNVKAISCIAAVAFVALCIYSGLSVGNYPPPIKGEDGLMGYVAKAAYSVPGIVYLLYIVKNWRRETQHG